MASDIPAWAGSVDASAVSSLLALQGERDWLDYKRRCDLSAGRDEVEFAKDAGAMMTSGGYILIGADDHGQPAGDLEHAELFDPAILHAKLAKYLPEPFEIRSAVHHHQGQAYALVYVVPHPAGLVSSTATACTRTGRARSWSSGRAMFLLATAPGASGGTSTT